jgi:hypothetical protein
LVLALRALDADDLVLQHAAGTVRLHPYCGVVEDARGVSWQMPAAPLVCGDDRLRPQPVRLELGQPLDQIDRLFEGLGRGATIDRVDQRPLQRVALPAGVAGVGQGEAKGGVLRILGQCLLERLHGVLGGAGGHLEPVHAERQLLAIGPPLPQALDLADRGGVVAALDRAGERELRVRVELLQLPQ